MMNNIYRGENAPCKDCQDRHSGCHPQCEAYKLYAEKREQARQERYMIKEIAEARYAGSIRRREKRRKKS